MTVTARWEHSLVDGANQCRLRAQRRDELVAELEALPEPREARSRGERLASEMAGLERSVQYKIADLASASPPICRSTDKSNCLASRIRRAALSSFQG